MFIHRRFNPIFINLYHFLLRKKKKSIIIGVLMFLWTTILGQSLFGISLRLTFFSTTLCVAVWSPSRI